MKLVDLSQNITKQSTFSVDNRESWFKEAVDGLSVLLLLWTTWKNEKKNRELEICDAEASDISIIICKGLEQRRKIGKI